MNAPSPTLYNMHAPTGYVLTLSCPDRPGIVFALTEFLLMHDCTIVECQQFIDRDGERFFIRIQFEAAYGATVELHTLRADFVDLAQRFTMQWRMLHASDKHRVLIMASKYGHCLNDLLFRADNGALYMQILSNDLCKQLEGRAINIHHSMLPSFKGARPYHQAYSRGVKVVGAT